MFTKNFVIETTININASASQVFSVLIDVERWPVWTASVNKVEIIQGKAFNVQTAAMVFQPKLSPAKWVVTAFTNNKGFTWQTTRPGLQLTATHAIETQGQTSAVTLTMQYTGAIAGLAYWLTAKLTKKYLQLECNGLKRQCEQTHQ